MLGEVADFVAAHVPVAIAWHCQLATVEAFTNVVRYAHRGLPTETLIPISIQRTAQIVEIQVTDQGPPFDWEHKLQEILANPPGPEAEGGRGMFWMYRLMDEVHYVRLDSGQNCLILRKQIPPVGDESAECS
jgi:serine/threonine-protein kinase RsbW